MPQRIRGALAGRALGQRTVVLDRGDTILPFNDYVRTPIRLALENGYIRSIEGELDAEYLRDYMAKFADEEAYAVSHWVGACTTAPTGPRSASTAPPASAWMPAPSREISCCSSGPNSEAGGNRHTACHLDIPMMHCSVHLDGQPMVIDGKVVA